MARSNSISDACRQWGLQPTRPQATRAPGDDLHLTLLMARHGLNFVVGKDREHLLAYARDVWEAAQAAKGGQSNG